MRVCLVLLQDGPIACALIGRSLWLVRCCDGDDGVHGGLGGRDCHGGDGDEGLLAHVRTCGNVTHADSS